MSLEDLLKSNFIQTNSVVYKWRNDMHTVFPDGILPGDWYIHLLHAQCGEIGFLPDIMAVYRKNESGIYFNNIHLKYGKQEIKFYDSVYKNIAHNSTHYLNNVYLPCAKTITDDLYKQGKFDILAQIKDEYPEIFEQAMNIKNKTEYKCRKYKKLYQLFAILSIIVLLLNLIQIVWRF